MAETRVIDDNMHFLPTNLFTNEEVLLTAFCTPRRSPSA